MHKFDVSKIAHIPSIGQRVMVNKRGHTFDTYTGIVRQYHRFNGKIQRIEIELDGGQDFKGGNGITFVTPTSLVKLD